jgi:hypothetical protein
VPFDERNFDAEGKMVDNPAALMIHEVEENKDYALLISTNSGAWRYLLGDTIRFVDKERAEVIITGRTRHYLSLVGEHLSVENMTKAVEMASNEMNISIPEFTVTGFPYKNLFAHKWYIACNDSVDANELIKKIDERICVLNDDYAVERTSALKEVFIEVLPEEKFLQFMAQKGKLGSQHKFPRVLKGKMLEDWKRFLQNGKAE